MHSLLLRGAPLLLTPVLLAASTFPGQFRVSATYWVLACVAAVAFLFGGRWPVSVSLVLSALSVPMFAAQAWGLSGLVPYLGAVALADLAAREDRDRVVATAAVCWLIALTLGVQLDAHTPRWTAADVTTVLAALGLPVLLGLYLRSQRQFRAAEAETLRATTESEVRAQERGSMARELHDLVAHHMASIVLRTGVAGHVVGVADPRVTDVLDDVHRTAADALADIRRWQTALRDPALHEVAMVEPDALLGEIDAAVQRTRAAGFTVAAEVDRNLTGLDAMARLTMLRVTQEALTNVMKHADPAGPVELTVRRDDDAAQLRVASLAGPAGQGGGHGIIGMTERLELAGGRITIGRTGDRWEVQAWLPVS